MSGREKSRDKEPLRRGLVLVGCAVFALIGAASMAYLYGPALTSSTRYHSDLTQTPHWVAYHSDVFAEDDPLVEYAAYSETPLQNTIYWVGTWFIDLVLLNKIVGITIFGMTAALFFWLVSSTSGVRTGVLASLFFVIFPRSAYEIAGGFSKAWTIGLVLIGVYVVETRAWRTLRWLMPLAAVTYPVAPVLVGAMVLVGLVMEFPRAADEAMAGAKSLIMGSGLALVPLLYKYFTPPASIGEMISTHDMNAIWERGEFGDVTAPLWQDVLRYVEYPFFIYGATLLLVLLHRRGMVWKRSWSALVIASTISYLVADLVVPRLYLPDRYTRFSMAVLTVLWFAHNGDRVIGIIVRARARRVATAAVVVIAFLSFSSLTESLINGLPWTWRMQRAADPVYPTFRPGDGDRFLNRWNDKEYVAPLSRAIRSLPPPVLVAGHPYDLGDVMLQSRRPVLVIHRMVHPWYSRYHAAMEARIQDSFRALFANHPDEVNRLVDRYGVTHLAVPKFAFAERLLQTGKMYESHYNARIRDLTRSRNFVVAPPPKDAIVFEDARFWLVRLPIGKTIPSSDEAGSRAPEPARGS